MNKFTLWEFIFLGIVILIIIDIYIAIYIEKKFNIGDLTLPLLSLFAIELIATLFIIGALI